MDFLVFYITLIYLCAGIVTAEYLRRRYPSKIKEKTWSYHVWIPLFWIPVFFVLDRGNA